MSDLLEARQPYKAHLHPRNRRGQWIETPDYIRTLIPNAHIVGGAVRDKLLGKTPKDYDFLAPGMDHADVRAALEGHGNVEDLIVDGRHVGVRFYPDNPEVVAPPEGIEIAPPRREVSTGPGRHEFEIVADADTSIEEDMDRRDFTVNAIAEPPPETTGFDPGVWFHVTTAERATRAREEGIRPRSALAPEGLTFGTVGVDEEAVYLWPTRKQATEWIDYLGKRGLGGDQMEVLRVQGIEPSRMAPDHESFGELVLRRYLSERMSGERPASDMRLPSGEMEADYHALLDSVGFYEEGHVGGPEWRTLRQWLDSRPDMAYRTEKDPEGAFWAVGGPHDVPPEWAPPERDPWRPAIKMLNEMPRMLRMELVAEFSKRNRAVAHLGPILRDAVVPAEEEPAYDGFIDPLGGVEDAKNKVLRVVGETAFRDDGLRIIRGLRFISQHDLDPDEETLAQMTRWAHRIKDVSGERVRDEFHKLLMGDEPAKALRVARDTGVLRHMFPEFSMAIGFEQQSRYHGLTADEHIFQVVQTAVEERQPLLGPGGGVLA